MKKKLKFIIGSFLAGVCNGVFGIGGGILIVPLLESLKLNSKVAHATSVAIVAIFCVFSFLCHYFCGYFDFWQSIYFVPAGMVGAVVGVFVLKKVRSQFLRRIFGVIILMSSIRLFFK